MRGSLNHQRLFPYLVFVMILGWVPLNGATQSPLFDRGYNVIPIPQKVELQGGDLEFGSGWRLETGQGVKPDDVAVTSLKEGLETRDGITLETRGRGKAIELAIQPGSVEIGQAADKD
ncbi:MAG TPA: hypothetical protein VMX16_19390, partial [Terriglobia bacterium]|nr:hypothetical protein [Terriglobia bacterium]